MVLKITNIILAIGLFFIGAPEGKLFKQYQTKINKHLIKVFDAENDLSTNLSSLETDKKGMELYRITNQLKTVGFLSILEVKSCSLNGCTARKSLNDNIGSEYFDIAVVTDESKHIKSIIVLEYFSDYGYEVTSKKYLKQYHGKALCSFSSQHPQVDGISGATISYNALISSLGDICQALEE